MPGDHPEAAYAARLLKHQDALQTEANRLVERLGLPTMLGRAGRFERLGSLVSGLMVWRDVDLGVSCGRLSPERAWDVMLPLAVHPRTARLDYRNETGALATPELRGYGRYYFVAHHETEAGDEWKIDVSLWSPEAPPGPLAHAQELRRRLTPRRGSRSCGSRTRGTGRPPTRVGLVGWTSTRRSWSTAYARPSSSESIFAGAVCPLRRRA